MTVQRRPRVAVAGARKGRAGCQTPPMPERVLQRLVRAVAVVMGWEFYHTHDSRRSDPGFPDCALTRDGRLVFAELKTARGKLSADQERWLAALRRVAGVEVYVFRPQDWYDGTIEGVLR